jgi:hypothetical protein
VTDALRDRLMTLRDELRTRLATADNIEAAWVHLLASTEICIAALPDDDAQGEQSHRASQCFRGTPLRDVWPQHGLHA